MAFTVIPNNSKSVEFFRENKLPVCLFGWIMALHFGNLSQNLKRFMVALVLLFGFMPIAECAGLVNDGVVSGAITVSGQQDTYTLTGNAGENVQIHAVSTSTTSFSPQIDIFDSSGVRVRGPSARRAETLLKSGTYTVVVSAVPAFFQTGNYNLYFVHLPGAN